MTENHTCASLIKIKISVEIGGWCNSVLHHSQDSFAFNEVIISVMVMKTGVFSWKTNRPKSELITLLY